MIQSEVPISVGILLMLCSALGFLLGFISCGVLLASGKSVQMEELRAENRELRRSAGPRQQEP